MRIWPSIPWLLAAALTTAGVAAPRTWADVQGRTVEAEFVAVDAENVRIRRTDGQEFTFSLARLSAEDRAYAVAQREIPNADVAAAMPPAGKIAALNAALGLPLFEAASLWSESPAGVARRLRLPVESRNELFESYRVYPEAAARVLGARPFSIALHGADLRVNSLCVMFANRGDGIDLVRQTQREAERAVDAAVKADQRTLSAALSAVLGEPKRESGPGGEAVWRWETGEHALLLVVDTGRYVALRVVPAGGAAARVRLSDEQVRRLLAERVTRRTGGDVIIDRIPMVNQGPKGYCVPATFERYLRYLGLPADMYVLAVSGGTNLGGGTSFEDMAEPVGRLARQNNRRLERLRQTRLTLALVARHIDAGFPLIWGLHSTEAFNVRAAGHTAARREVGDWIEWKRALATRRREPLRPGADGAHACLIIGYNRATDEIAISDSWGPQFAERWVPLADAADVSMGEFWRIDS